jgi:ornithine carrier protein
MLENAVLFAAYERIQTVLKSITHSDTLSLSQLGLAGALSGSCAAVVLTPVELIKCRVQVHQLQAGLYTEKPTDSPLKRRGTWSILRNVVNNEGLAGFYRGFSFTLSARMNSVLILTLL